MRESHREGPLAAELQRSIGRSCPDPAACSVDDQRVGLAARWQRPFGAIRRFNVGGYSTRMFSGVVDEAAV